MTRQSVSIIAVALLIPVRITFAADARKIQTAGTQSPDKNIAITVRLSRLGQRANTDAEGRLEYKVDYAGREVISYSYLLFDARVLSTSSCTFFTIRSSIEGANGPGRSVYRIAPPPS